MDVALGFPEIHIQTFTNMFRLLYDLSYRHVSNRDFFPSRIIVLVLPIVLLDQNVVNNKLCVFWAWQGVLGHLEKTSDVPEFRAGHGWQGSPKL